MPQFTYAHAHGSDWRAVAKSCAEQLEGATGNLGFLYATDRLADHLGEILSTCRKATSVVHWVGTVGVGVCATGREYLDEPAVAAMVGDFEPGSFKVFSGVSSEGDVRRLDLKCGESQAAFALVHADPYNSQAPQIVAKLAEKVESGFLLGGLTSSRQQNLQIADRVIEGGLSGVAFSDSVTIATRLTQGCSPIGPKHTVTNAQRNMIVTLDGRPALEVFLEDIGERLAAEIERIGGHVFVGISIPGSDTGDYLVRNLVGIDPANKLVAIGELLRAQRADHVLPQGRRDRAGRHDAHAREHQAGPVRAAARRGVLLVPGARREPVRAELGGAEDDPGGARRHSARRLLLQWRDLAQPPLRLYRRPDAFPVLSA